MQNKLKLKLTVLQFGNVSFGFIKGRSCRVCCVLTRRFPKMYISTVLSSSMLKMSDQHTLVPSVSADTLNLFLLISNKNEDIRECHAFQYLQHQGWKHVAKEGKCPN